jgi:hypothetical protein
MSTPLEPVVIPATPDKQDVALGHPDVDTAPIPRPSLHAVILEAIDQAYRENEDAIREEDLAVYVERAILDATGGPHHIVVVKGYAWTVTHPITERFTGTPLHQCPYVPLVAEAALEEDGTFQVWLDRNALRWEPTQG